MASFNYPLRGMVVAAATLVLLVVSVSLVALAHNTADYTEAEQTNTLKFLQMFSSWTPLMASNWTGTDFCSWVDVTCLDNGDLALGLGIIFDELPEGYTFSLPEMSDDIVGEDVVLNQFAAAYLINHLVGTLPNTWGRLTRITHFYVMSLNVTGTLPESYGAWSKVRTMNFYNHELTGSIPASWGQMTSLESISIASSHLCGCIPEEWRLMSLSLSTPSRVEAENCSTANVCPLETTTTTTTTTTEEPTASSSSASSTSATTTTTTEEPTASSSSASSTSATTNSTTAVCAVEHCLQCHEESASVCVLCATGYTLTTDMRCALPISSARFPTTASTGLWTALVVLVCLMAFVSPA